MPFGCRLAVMSDTLSMKGRAFLAVETLLQPVTNDSQLLLNIGTGVARTVTEGSFGLAVTLWASRSPRYISGCTP